MNYLNKLYIKEEFPYREIQNNENLGGKAKNSKHLQLKLKTMINGDGMY